MKKMFAAAFCAAFLAMSAGMVCPAEEQTDQAVTSGEENAVTEKKLIGEKQEGALRARLTNVTGKNITTFAIKEETAEEFTENLLAEGDVFADGEARIFYYVPESAEDGADGEETAYVILLGFDDDTAAELHAFSFSEMKRSRIRLKEDTAYLVYKKDGERTTTLEAEQEIAGETQTEQQDDGEAVEYDDAYYDDGAGYEDTYYDDSASYEDTYYDDSASYDNTYYDSGSSYSGGSSGSGGGGSTAAQNCLQGGLMN